MNVRAPIAVVAFVFILVAAAPSAFAADPCAGDVKKFCADTKPGAGRMALCLSEHDKDLSPQCKTHREKARANATAFGTSCGDDVKKLCASVKSGGGRIMKCLEQKQTELSAGCKSYVKSQSRTKSSGTAPAPKSKS